MKIKFNCCFAILLALLILTTGISVCAAEEIRLKKQDTSDNTPFAVGNMFPGDSETRDYVVKVAHKKDTSLYFRADVRRGYEKLAEVMMIKVYLPEKDIVLYDGLMADMPSMTEYVLDEDEGSLLYRITVYLHTSVGNDYQNKHLVSDFRWWYMEDKQEDNKPGGNYPGGTGPFIPVTKPDSTKPDSTKPDGNQPGEVEPDSGSSGNTGDAPSQESTDKKDSVSVKITAENILDGQYPRGDDFKYTLRDEDNNIIQTVTNEDGHIEFDTIVFEQEGIYKYYIISEGSSQDHILHDNSVCEIVITVNRVDGRLTADVVYTYNGEEIKTLPRFEHKTKTTEALPGTVLPTNPKTGDETDIMLYIYMLAGSLAGIFILLFFMRRKREGENE